MPQCFTARPRPVGQADDDVQMLVKSVRLDQRVQRRGKLLVGDRDGHSKAFRRVAQALQMLVEAEERNPLLGRPPIAAHAFENIRAPEGTLRADVDATVVPRDNFTVNPGICREFCRCFHSFSDFWLRAVQAASRSSARGAANDMEASDKAASNSCWLWKS